MFVEMLENVGTAKGSYLRNETYAVAEAMGRDLVKAGHARRATEPLTKSKDIQTAIRELIANASRNPMRLMESDATRLSAELLARLEAAAGQTALFLPFLGEVGWLIMYHLRFVHFHKAQRKIVCCQRGQECLFPGADEFFYDWNDPIDDSVRAGTDRETRTWPQICDRFPGAAPIVAGGVTHDQELVPLRIETPIHLKPRTTRGLKVDVCIGVRNRKFLPAKNYSGWPSIAAELQRRGITYAVIGSRASSYALDGMECMSGDFGDWDAAIELLQNCRLFIGTDSGGAHLASAVRACPMIVQQVPDTAAGTTRCFIPRMAATTCHELTHLPPSLWTDSQAMIRHTLKALE